MLLEKRDFKRKIVRFELAAIDLNVVFLPSEVSIFLNMQRHSEGKLFLRCNGPNYFYSFEKEDNKICLGKLKKIIEWFLLPWNLILVLSVIITGILYLPVDYYFLNDDFIHIPASGRNEFFQHGFQRPVHEGLLFLEYKLWGTQAWGFHLTRLIIHFVNAWLVYRLTGLLFTLYGEASTDSVQKISTFASSIFLIYAFHSESMFWILGAGASLSTLFILLSIIYYLRSDKIPGSYWLSVWFFLLALFTYESSWILPVIIVVLYYFDFRPKPARVGSKWKLFLFWILFVGNLFFRAVCFEGPVSEYGLPVGKFQLTQLLLNYNRLFARSLLPPMNNTVLFVLCYVVVLALIAWWIWNQWLKGGRIRLLLLLLLCFFLSLVPFLGLGIDTHDRESERFLYLASVFLCMLFAYVILSSSTSEKVQMAWLVLFLVVHAFFVRQNARDYHIAGRISASLFRSIGDVKDQRAPILIPVLPVEFNGVPLLRVGLEEGTVWLAGKDSSRLQVGSHMAIRYKQGVVGNPFVKSVIASFELKQGKHVLLQFAYDSSQIMLVPFP